MPKEPKGERASVIGKAILVTRNVADENTVTTPRRLIELALSRAEQAA